MELQRINDHTALLVVQYPDANKRIELEGKSKKELHSRLELAVINETSRLFRRYAKHRMLCYQHLLKEEPNNPRASEWRLIVVRCNKIYNAFSEMWLVRSFAFRNWDIINREMDFLLSILSKHKPTKWNDIISSTVEFIKYVRNPLYFVNE